MKRIIFLVIPVVVLMLALRPVHSINISGRVTDEVGMPIAGAEVRVKGTSVHTNTAKDGRFSLSVENDSKILEVSASGYATQEISLKGATTVSVVLQVAATDSISAKGEEMRQYDMKAARGRMNKSSLPNMGYADNMVAGSGYMVNEPKDEIYEREGYDHITENGFHKVSDDPLSTFSIDVDAASYSNVRRFLNQGVLPPAGAVRIEEMINYFKYAYPQPESDQPFSINTEMANAPWNKEHKLVLIGLQGKQLPTENLPASNLVFLIDVSGSMESPEKLPLVKASMKLLVDQLREQDKVSIVVYAGAAGLVLSPTSGSDKTKIKDAIDHLEAGGSTAGGEGIELAYATANKYFAKDGNNRVILCTDGDFNIGASSDDAMERLIEQERKTGIFLTVLGYGMGNYQDAKMQKLADKGNGNHAYIDGLSEAKKVLVNEFGGTLFTIAKDVKLQVEFNPAKVQGYRLIGYENRVLAKEDFNDDKKDAGELGSGHTVTALYEIIPVGVKTDLLGSVDPLKYQSTHPASGNGSSSNELITVKFRYKAPAGETSRLIEQPVRDKQLALENTSDNFRFAASVAEFGMLLRNSEFKGTATFGQVLALAKRAKGTDDEGYRSEFIQLVGNAQLIAKESYSSPGKPDEVARGQRAPKNLIEE